MADAKTEKQKVKEITDKLEEGLKELFESEKYKNYLSTMSKFHNYSFNNTLLINLQRPGAIFVAGYKAWQTKYNRHVNKDENGIRILAPAPYKIKEERNKLDPVTGEVLLDKDGMKTIREADERWLCLLFGEPYEAEFQSGAVHVYDGNGDEVLTYTAGVGWHEKESKAETQVHGVLKAAFDARA